MWSAQFAFDPDPGKRRISQSELEIRLIRFPATAVAISSLAPFS